jgi:hypothetical protein
MSRFRPPVPLRRRRRTALRPRSILGGVSEVEPQDVRRLSRLFLLALPLLVFALDFLALLVTYLLLSLITPTVLGKVATHPALYATSIALAKLPITLIYMTAVSWHAWTAIVTRGEFLPPPVPKGGRRTLAKVRDYGMEAAASAAAALIILNYVIDPGEAHHWQLATVTAVVPLLLPLPLKGVAWLIRRWWRSRPATDHSTRAPSTTPD